MKTIKDLSIGIALAAVVYFLIGCIGFRPLAFLSEIYMIILFAVHLISSIALFNETRLRKKKNQELFLSLGALYWALIGLLFGIIGIIIFKIVNSNSRIYESN